MSELVILSKNEPVTTTLVIARGMKLKHNAVLFLVKKYKKRLENISTLEVALQKSAGRPTSFYFLNEQQTVFLVTLMKNSEVVLDFKDMLVKEFFRMKKALALSMINQKNKEWDELREAGKLTRREETDTIKEFIEYAKGQGSQSAEKYYMNISKMENSALFVLEQKFPNLRNVLSGQQLHIISTADIAVAQALKDGMEQKLHYKDIYQLAKERIETMATIIPKTLVPMIDKRLLS